MHYSGAPGQQNHHNKPETYFHAGITHNAPTPVREAEHRLTLQVFNRYHPLEAITISSVATLETVLGTTGDDTLSTDLLNDFVVDGLAGDDTITIEETASALQVQARGGEDLIVAAGGVSDSDKIKGGADSDTFDFQGAVSSSSIYGGKGGDSISFDRTLTGGVVKGDTGNDTILVTGKIDGGALIDGGADDDLITLNERITSSTVLGGAAQDTLDVNDNSESALLKLGSDDDSLTITGKHGSLRAKGNAGDDTFTIESGFSGTGNAFYGGKGEDVVTLSSTAKVDSWGTKRRHSHYQDNSSMQLRGGDGDDVVNLARQCSPCTEG